MKRWILLLGVLAASAQLAACNTISGVGKDLKKAGEKLEDAAKK